MTGWIGISLGDVTGIGPEVALKAVAAEAPNDDRRYLLIGDADSVNRFNQKPGLNLPLKKFVRYGGSGRFFIVNPSAGPLPENLPAGSPAAANAAVAWLRDGAERCLRRELDALVTAPVNKESIIRAGHKFIGQTEFLSGLAGAGRTAMMLLGQDEHGRWLRVALATVHMAIKSVPGKLTPAKLELAIELAAKACRDLQLPRARVAVCGLNPHAGEGGGVRHRGELDARPAVHPHLARPRHGLRYCRKRNRQSVIHDCRHPAGETTGQESRVIFRRPGVPRRLV